MSSQVCKVTSRTQIKSASADGTQLLSCIVVKDKKRMEQIPPEKTE